jgi:hypothetical protein|tara:strand:+ start:128 stop:406 length:279 start_codon:yes stop_codon:yes gene_type:complete
MTKRVIEHEIKLEKSVKIILAALAFGVLAHAFATTFSVESALARSHAAPMAVAFKGTLPVRIQGPISLGGELSLGGNLGLGGTVKCDGCVPK